MPTPRIKLDEQSSFAFVGGFDGHQLATSSKGASAEPERYDIQSRTLSVCPHGHVIFMWVVEPKKSSSAVHGGSGECTSVCQIYAHPLVPFGMVHTSGARSCRVCPWHLRRSRSNSGSITWAVEEQGSADAVSEQNLQGIGKICVRNLVNDTAKVAGDARDWRKRRYAWQAPESWSTNSKRTCVTGLIIGHQSLQHLQAYWVSLRQSVIVLSGLTSWPYTAQPLPSRSRLNTSELAHYRQSIVAPEKHLVVILLRNLSVYIQLLALETRLEDTKEQHHVNLTLHPGSVRMRLMIVSYPRHAIERQEGELFTFASFHCQLLSPPPQLLTLKQRTFAQARKSPFTPPPSLNNPPPGIGWGLKQRAAILSAEIPEDNFHDSGSQLPIWQDRSQYLQWAYSALK
ncbi:hypothetical protein V8E53_000251 [Lactarius tabidus]